MVNFAFFHYEDQYTIMGKMLTYSIKKIYPKSSVISIRGRKQPPIESVDYSEKWDFPKGNVMYDDVACKVHIREKYGPTVFIDADMLLIRDIDKFFEIGDCDFSLTERTEKSKLQFLNYESHKDRFPGLVNKTLGETMPYNGGIYFCKNLDAIKYMLASFDSMSEEYFSWYGIQIALLEMVKSNLFKVKIFKDMIYNYTPSNIEEDLGTKVILHFKGSKRYLFIPFFKKIFGLNVFKKIILTL